MEPPSASPACPSCGCDQVACTGDLAPGVRFSGRMLATPLPGGRLYRCAGCHLRFRYPLLPKETLDTLYRNGDLTMWQYEPADRQDWSIARRWLQAHYPTGSVLDVGCYDGAFLAYLGDAWDRFGIELHEQAAARAQARGVEIIGRDAEMLRHVQRRFDVVVAFDLIEHVRDPRDLLGQMAARTRPGGVVIIGTGNVEAPSWKLMKSRYWYCSLPEHLAFIGESWCRSAAQALGLELIFTERYSHAQRHSPLLVLSEVVKNMLFRFFPPVFGVLRAHGFGGIDARQHPAWRQVPPAWMTAKDHLLAIFQIP